MLPATRPVLKRETAMILVQSGEVDGPVLAEEKAEQVEQHETVQFVDAGLPEESGRATIFEPTYSEHTDEVAMLGDFLKRPVLIDQFTWNESDTFTLSPRTIRPWYLYFNNTYIKSKLSNYARLHCSLKLTFRFNASPFYYGGMRVCYDPLASGKFDPLSTEDIVPMSQTLGVMLEPQVTSVATLELPFLWPHSWLDTSSASQFQQMGKIIFQVFSQLQSANGVTGTGITISTYAEACDVEITGPTTKALLQSGVVSGPATAIANFAKNFANAGAIGPYARAVDIGATAVSRIAKIFGFSNAPITGNVGPVQNKVFHAFANTETRVPIDKLAIDPANEVTIDNRVTGDVGEDPLIIQKLVTKPSIVKVITWSSSTVANTILQHGAVTPCILREAAGTSQTYEYYTPSGWAAEMFRFWRGGMRYTFRVHRSKYHKGRLIVCWDPNGELSSLGVETAVFSKIFDLSSPEQEFTVDIPFKACSPWLLTTNQTGLEATAFTPNAAAVNGYFVLGVLNPLTGPTSSASVNILVSAQALEDMEFAAPSILPRTTTTAAIQSAEVEGKATMIATDGGVFDGAPVKYSERIPDITVGERIGSLRTVLHRATRAMTQHLGWNFTSSVSVPGGHYHTVNFFDRLPPTYGFQTSDSYNWATAVVGTGVKPANFCANHPINWVLAGFAGYRGSIVVHTNVSNKADASDTWNLSLDRIDHTYDATSASNTVRNASFKSYSMTPSAAQISSDSMALTSTGYPYFPTGAGGIVVTNGKTQMAMSAVIPQYCRTRFMPAAYSQRNNDFIATVYDGFRLDADICVESSVSNATALPHVDVYWAAGVDFNPVFFTGIPRLYKYNPPSIYNTAYP